MKHIKRGLLPVFLFLLMCLTLSGCADTGGDPAQPSAPAASAAELTAAYGDGDLDGDWDASSATRITLSGSSASVSGSGASVNGATVTISQAGVYAVSGTLDDGQILIDAGKEDPVRLVLNGASLTCTTSAPIYAKQANKLILTLAEGTQNSVTDGEAYPGRNSEEEPDAAIFSKDDLTINGSGALTVTGQFRNGIGTKDNLVVADATLNITAANDGLRGRDGITIHSGILTVHAENDAIKSNHDEDAEQGFILIEGGSFELTAGHDGIQAETLLQIEGGAFQITAGGGSENAAKKANETPGGFGFQRPSSDSADTTQTEADDSYKGIKAGGGLTIRDGSFSMDCADDTVHSNGDILIAGGSFALATGDDGFHADGGLTIQDGTVDISASYEGLEGESIQIGGGSIRLTASDDGMNAAGGSDGDTAGGLFGGDSFRASGKNVIHITGGALLIDAEGDGIDSNDSLYFEGGTVLVSGPTDSGNGALDFNGTCEISGGVLIAAGSSGMMQAPGTSSPQSSLAVTYSSTQQAGTLLSLTDGDGNLIAAFSPKKSYQSVVISTPALAPGSSYTLASGGYADGLDENGYAASGTVAGAAARSTIPLSGAVTSVSDDGTAVSGGMGGGMGGGAPQGGGPGRR